MGDLLVSHVGPSQEAEQLQVFGAEQLVIYVFHMLVSPSRLDSCGCLVLSNV